MELRQVRYFVRLAELLHFGRAAAAESIAPSAFSAQIARLEREVGRELVERGPRRVRLTPAGEAFLDHALSTLRSADLALAAARTALPATTGRVVVGLLDGGAAAELTVPIVQAFRGAHPGVTVALKALGFRGHVEALERGEVDCVLGALFAEETESVTALPLFTDPRVAVLPAAHPLAEAEQLSVADLLDEPFVHGATLPGEMDAHFSLAAHRNGERARRLPEPVAAWPEVLALVATGGAVTTATRAAARFAPFPGVSYRPLPDAADTTTALLLRRTPSDPLTQALADSARTTTRDLLLLIPGAHLPTGSADAV